MKEGTATEVKHGWRYMPLVSPKEERAGLSRVPAPEADSIAWIAQGTGVVVELLTTSSLVATLSTTSRLDEPTKSN